MALISLGDHPGEGLSVERKAGAWASLAASGFAGMICGIHGARLIGVLERFPRDAECRQALTATHFDRYERLGCGTDPIAADIFAAGTA